MKLQLLVEGGNAKGAALGPALGPIGVPLPKVLKEINQKTKKYEGIEVPVTLEIDEATKEFKVKVGSPYTSALIKKELGIEKGSGTPRTESVGNLSLDQVIKISKRKQGKSLSKDFKKTVKEVVGTCRSMGVKIEDKPAKELLKEIGKGKFDKVLKG